MAQMEITETSDHDSPPVARLPRLSVTRLQSLHEARARPVLQFDVVAPKGTTTYHLLNGVDAAFVLIPRLLGSPHFRSSDFRVETLGVWQSIQWHIANIFDLRRKTYLRFPKFTLRFDGPKPTRRLQIYLNRLLTRIRSRPDDAVVQTYPQLLTGWTDDRMPASVLPQAISAAPRIVIVAHVYYPDSWPEIAAILAKMPDAIDIIITLPDGRDELAARIQSDCPRAITRAFENRGRDVRPFIQLLEDGTLSTYDLICKIHGKKSFAWDPSGNLGDICRRRSFFDLLAGPRAIERITARFAADPEVGMIGSRSFHHHQGRKSLDVFWKGDRHYLGVLASMLGVDIETIEPNFFEGTMFWVRYTAIRRLGEIELSQAFGPEKGASGGELEHAVERIFGSVTRLAGYVIEDIDAIDG